MIVSLTGEKGYPAQKLLVVLSGNCSQVKYSVHNITSYDSEKCKSSFFSVPEIDFINPDPINNYAEGSPGISNFTEKLSGGAGLRIGRKNEIVTFRPSILYE